MMKKEGIDGLTVLLEVISNLESNHKNVLESILNEIDLSDEAYASSVKDVESLLKGLVF